MRGNNCAQLFVSDKGYVAIYPMESKGNFKDALHMFCKDIGVPTIILVDPSGGAEEQICSKVFSSSWNNFESFERVY